MCPVRFLPCGRPTTENPRASYRAICGRGFMKLRLCLLLAAISVAIFAARVESARRPRYGGTLRVEIGAAVNSLDPAASAANPDEAAARQQIDALLYDQRNSNGTFAGIAGSGA